MAVRLGCIDIGSNTTRLLVADRDGSRLLWIHQERAFTRIGQELLERGVLGPEKIAEVVAVVTDQLASARRVGASAVRAVATAAIRTAVNGAELAEAVTAATGLTVEVLSGEEEARLAFVGVARTLDDPPAGELAGGRRFRSARPPSPTPGCVLIRPRGHSSTRPVGRFAPSSTSWRCRPRGWP